MVAVTVDANIRAALSKADSPVELRGEDGMLLGYFTPIRFGTAEDYRRAREHFDPEELKRRKALNERGITTRELLDQLNSLEQP